MESCLNVEMTSSTKPRIPLRRKPKDLPKGSNTFLNFKDATSVLFTTCTNVQINKFYNGDHNVPPHPKSIAATTLDIDAECAPVCSFSTATSGLNHRVPLVTGCKLSKMITLSGDMTVTGGTGTSKIMHDLHAVGETRHFLNFGHKLTLRWLKLIGGQTDPNSHGGSIITEGGTVDVADSMFLGCGSGSNTRCAKDGGAVHGESGAIIKCSGTIL